MPGYVCKLCGEPVWADPGREIRSAAAHAKESGHANAGLTHPHSAHARQVRWTPSRRPSPQPVPQARGGFPSQRRVFFGLGVLVVAVVAAVSIAEAVDNDPPAFQSCHTRVAC
ncbi:hypothetical protein [Streptomyces sp. Tu 4128]|uniref:hypothetical protein n=1 Tax=Streptomyces sp. Tu 4128 TaxID=1120314 RepID=UPI000F01CEA7|nr:hypothetical protein [Streptomyces sp. Tu 4128]